MKLLLLTKKFPFPLKDGESVAVDTLSRSLVALGIEVSLLSMNTTKHHVEVSRIRDQVSQYTEVVTSDVDNRLKIKDAFVNLFSKESYHISRFDYVDFRHKLSDMLEAIPFDIVLMESIYLTPYIDTIRKYSDAPIIMRAHNIEYEIWQRVNRSTKNPIKRAYLKLLISRLKSYEEGQLAQIDGLITFTDRDMETFTSVGYTGQSLVAPIGIDTAICNAEVDNDPAPTIGFIGSLDWMPNIEGVHWFVSKIWPLVIEKVPEAVCHIAGRNPRDEILNIRQKGITIHGEVEDAAAFVSRHPISIVPLLSGGGMRVKILEAMALSRCIVSTSIGAEGIDTSALIIAADAKIFAERLISLLHNPKSMKSYGDNARAVVVKKYDTKQNGKSVLSFIEKVVENHGDKL